MPLRRSWAWFFVCFAALMTQAAAHPLGNFTINHLAKITASDRALHLRYVLDLAEIPTFQIMHSRDKWDPIQIVQSGLHVRIDGTPVTLQTVSANARLRPGAGGLPIIRWVGEFTALLEPGGAHRVTVDDAVYASHRIGWKDIIAGSQTEPTDELWRYPSALIGTPRRIKSVTFTVSAGGIISQIRRFTDTAPVEGTLSAWVSPTILSEMFSRPSQTPFFVILTMIAAFGLGALHAAEPGHGKALLAFTLVGARATVRQALTLAVSLTFAHTIGVLLLGLVLFFASGFVSESIYPWITLVSGIAIAIIGARALARIVHSRAHGHSHDELHAHHGKLLNFRSAIWAAMSGGIAPCPAAIVVLLAALRLHQLGYGIVLIVIFSAGLASVLSAVGIGVVHGSAWLSQRSSYSRLAPYSPVFSAIVISFIGAYTLAQGLHQQSAAAPTPIVAALALAAIGGYAFSQASHTHLEARA